MATLLGTATGSPGANGGATGSVDTTGATFIAISASWYFSGITFSDNKSNTWTLATLQSSSSNVRHQFAFCFNPIVGSGHTFSVTGSGIYPAIIVHYFSGTEDLDYLLRVGAGSASTASPLATGSITPFLDDSIILSGFVRNPTLPPALACSGFTQTDVEGVPGTNVAGSAAYLIQNPAATIDPTWSWSSGSYEVAASSILIEFFNFNPVYRQTDTGVLSGGAPTYTKTFAADVVAGNILVASVSCTATTASSITDDLGNTWTKHREQGNSGTTRAVSTWTTVSIASGACTVTLTTAGGVGTFRVYEYTANGITSLALDTSNGANTSATTTHAAGSVTPSVDDTWAIFNLGIAGGFTISSGPTDYIWRDTVISTWPQLYDRKMVSPATHNPTLTTGSNETGAVQVVVLKSGAPALVEVSTPFIMG